MLNARIVVAVYALLTAQIIAAQPSSSSLSGMVIDHNGAPVAEAPVRAVQTATGTDERTYSSASGRYQIQGLPAGSYVVSVASPCCASASYANDGVTLEAGQALELVIELDEGVSLNALGDDPGTIAAALRARQVIPDLPVPRTADGKPDLSGVWLVNTDPFPEPPEALPWAEEISQQRIANYSRDHPHTRCLPAAPPIHGGSTPFISKYIQIPELLVILFEDVPGFRQVFLDGRDHPVNPNPSWMGHSIGRWEGDTLVVDTVGFNDRAWTDTYPRSEMMHTEERYTRTEYGRMELQMTFDDPGVFVKPLVNNFPFDLAPQEELIEYVCENNKWARNTEE